MTGKGGEVFKLLTKSFHSINTSHLDFIGDGKDEKNFFVYVVNFHP